MSASHARKLFAAVCLPVLLAGCGGGTSTATSPSTTTSSPSSLDWSGVLAPGGTTSRSFTIEAAGTVSVTLTSAGERMGLGVGLPRTTGGGCRLGVAVEATPGPSPQISTSAEAGQYCVQVYDLGTLTNPTPFSIKLTHP